MTRLICAATLAGLIVSSSLLAGVEPAGQEKLDPAKGNQPAAQGIKVQQADKAAAGMQPQRKWVAGNGKLVVADEQLRHSQIFQSLHKYELHFMRLVCQPSREQFERIAADSEPAVREVLEKSAPVLGPDLRIVANVGMERVGRDMKELPDIPRQVAAALAKSVRKVLSAKQADQYDLELARRLEESHRTQVQGFVVKMDDLLHLSNQQREALEKLLLEAWGYSSGRSTFLANDIQNYPPMPDPQINQILTEPQRHVWAGVRKGIVRVRAKLEVAVDADFEEVWDEPAAKAASHVIGVDGQKKQSAKKEGP
jgi:hypothetical protein